MTCWFKTRWRWTWIAFMVLAAGAADFRRSDGEGQTPGQLAREGKYIEVIRSLDQTWRAKGRLSPQEMKLYVDVYYLYGEGLLKKGDVKNARACFLRVISLDRRHPDSYYQLGIIGKRAKNYQNALPYLRTAILSGSRHSPEANRAILEIAQESLAAAEKAMDAGDVATARAHLNFVGANFAGEDRNKALELATYRLNPLARAAAEYARATRLLTARDKTEGMRALRGIAGSYPGTFFARKANEVLEGLGEEIIVVQTATGLQLPPKWKRKETAHFAIYYEKEMFFNRIAPQAEKMLPQIFATFGYAKPNWRQKCKVYLFSNRSDWQRFLETNRGKVLEWFEAFAIEKAMEIYLYESNDTSAMLERILPHELTHVVHHSVVGDMRYTPIWLQEGLAGLHEEGKRKQLRRMLRNSRRGAAYIPLTELVSSTGYPADTGRVSMFYLESAALLDVLLENFGPVKIREMALAYRRRTSFDAVLRNVFGITAADLEKLWKKYAE